MGVKPPYEVVALGWRVWDPEAPKYTYWVVNVGMCGWVLGVVLLFARSGSFSGGVLATTVEFLGLSFSSPAREVFQAGFYRRLWFLDPGVDMVSWKSPGFRYIGEK